jgi:PAS domain S-box-containing protein
VVRRVAPFAFAAAILAGVLAVTAVAAAQPPVALAVYLGVVVFASVIAGVAVAASELVGEAREAAAEAERRVGELEAKERRLRATVEAAGVGLGLANLDGSFVELSDRLTSLLGARPGSHITDLIAEVDAGAVADGLEMVRNGDVTRWEAEVSLRPTGAPAGLLIMRVPNTAADEPLLLVQGTDIAARRRAERLQACAAAVRQVIVSAATVEHGLPQVLRVLSDHLGWTAAQQWALEPDGRSMRVVRAWAVSDPMIEAFLHSCRGFVLTEGAGLAGRAWQSGVVAADSDIEHGASYQPATAARAAELRSAVAFPVIANGDVVGVVELVSRELHDPGEDEVALYATAGVELGQFIVRAETARALRRSEADHRAIFERSPIGIARIGTGGDLVEANASLLQMLGHDAGTMRDTAWPELLRAYDLAAARARKPPFLAGGAEVTPIQVRAATGSGTWLWLQVTATTIPDSSGAPEHVLVMVEDVTAIRETSDRLAEALEAQREANANLGKLDKTKSEFLSIVSHEFRTALTGMQGFSELIRDGGLEADEVRAYGGYIFNDADRVNRLIGDMLDLDRMESGRMTMRAADVDINDIVMEAISRAAPSAVGVEFKSDLDPRLPIVAGDRDRLIQVLSNLVNNAVKYSPDGGTVTLASRVEGRFALISVTDTGVGIPPDEIGHVFERFRRVRSGAAQSIPGTGLGLTIVKQIVEMHGGKIWVESAVGHGSSFHFTIPLAPESATALQLRHD